MHSDNIHNEPYPMKTLQEVNPLLKPYVFENEYNTQTIDFSDPDAVFQLNKSLLMQFYNIQNWELPKQYLCPPIPGRADYLYHINDLLEKPSDNSKTRGLDIGVGANTIYPLLAARIFGWNMVGSDIDETAVHSAEKNVASSEGLSEKIEIRRQTNNADIFKGIIKSDEYFDFTMCNPPFHASEEEAHKANLRKVRNLQKPEGGYYKKEDILLNFGGQANELWCNGGEALFIKRMIKDSIGFKAQVGWFTTLVSKKDNLNKIYKQLNKAGATHKTLKMDQGNKTSRIVAWKF
ncbi:23S rRNA (adenine(1618)-N(6))-methyltransferase RlmF [Cochleicola gelatinilyticus]|uniref:Ribosomal RNA large subunit methyltransferase F n=1 Tax=Cochleicola gelatinilyticus TaxID=1763537 RepID=A0A167GY39_9FLAO|nr:23S rRNA (adenine(1618)-N(6))-methyltransferase RlmF [Cochleicola gelatinilyticus]OAB78027.1 23S rRNA methyltransferase [Cochleicola gelatinilyticus]